MHRALRRDDDHPPRGAAEDLRALHVRAAGLRGTTTITAGIQSIRLLYVPLLSNPEKHLTGLLNIVFTSLLLLCIVLILGGSILRWIPLASSKPQMAAE